MTSVTQPPASGQDREYLLSAEMLIDAPRDVVWEKAKLPEFWKDCFDGDGFSAKMLAQDVREGGSYRFSVETLGMEFQFRGEYLSIREPEGVEFTSIWENVDQDDEEETKVVFAYSEEEGDKTKLLIKQYGFKSITIHDFYKEFWDHYLKTLAAFCR